MQEALGKDKGYDYARTAHPNRRALERCVARLEGGQAAYVFTSGMAAIDAMFRLLRPGDHTLISRAVYGGVYRLTTQFLCQFGMEFSFVDTSDLEVRSAFATAVERVRDDRKHLLRRLAIDEVQVSTDGSIVEPLFRFFRKRETRSRTR